MPPSVPARASGRAAAALAAGDDPEPDDYKALLADLRSIVRRAASFPTSEIADIADESVAKLVAAANTGRVRADTALAYVRKIARHEVIDRLRARRPERPSDDDFPDDSDDAIARVISATADARTVEAVLRAAAHRGDTTATRVMNAYLTLAGSLRRDPTSREVARMAEVSHKTVADVLARLRRELGHESPPDG